MPSTSDSILKQLNVPARSLPETFSIDLYPGHKIGTPSLLFTRIDEKMEQVWRNKFGGSQSNNEEAKPQLSKSQLAKQAKAAKQAKETVKVPDTPETKALNESISKQGTKVRDIKSGAIKGGDLGAEVENLKKLKVALEELAKKLTNTSL